jgi:hypothetical protein
MGKARTTRGAAYGRLTVGSAGTQRLHTAPGLGLDARFGASRITGLHCAAL